MIEQDVIKVNIEEAQKLYGKSRATIYNWVKTGKVKSVLNNGEKYIVMSHSEYAHLTKQSNEILEKSELESSESCIKSNVNNLDSNSSNLESSIRMSDPMEVIKLLVMENKGLTTEVINASKEKAYYESQVKLLTLQDENTKDEYMRLNAENRELNAKLHELQNKISQIESRKSFWDILRMKL